MLRGENETYSLGRKDYLVNLGYCREDGEEEIEIFFTDKNKYDLEQMEICYVSLAQYTEHIEELNRETLQNVKEETNMISGTVSVSEEKIMVFSIPYSSGWTAYVDGREAKLMKANVMYMGVVLEPGEHEIVLRYCTPGFRTGLLLTAISAVLFFLLLWRWRKKKDILFRCTI